MIRNVLQGAAAGAAGTTALNAVTYVDMALRGRPTSTTPEKTVEEMADEADVQIPGDDDERSNRVSGLGPLLGLASGVAVGALYGGLYAWGWRPRLATGAVFTSVAALVGTNGPMTLLGVTDPRTWPRSAVAADVVPHLAYGVVTAAVVREMNR